MMTTELSAAPLSTEELARFQEKLLALLVRCTALYTMGESTSLPEKTAQELLASLCYLLRADSPARVRHLLDCDLMQEYRRGVQRTEGKLHAARKLWEQVCLTVPDPDSRALRDTLKSIGGVWRTYDSRYAAHLISADIDYQPALPIPETLQGMDYLLTYLRQLLMENAFLSCFSADRKRRLMEAVSPIYRDLLLNLCEPVAAVGTGLVLAGGGVRSLNLSDGDCHRAAERVLSLPETDALRLLQQSGVQMGRELGLSPDVQNLTGSLAAQLLPRIRAAEPSNSLRGVFPELTGCS